MPPLCWVLDCPGPCGLQDKGAPAADRWRGPRASSQVGACGQRQWCFRVSGGVRQPSTFSGVSQSLPSGESQACKGFSPVASCPWWRFSGKATGGHLSLQWNKPPSLSCSHPPACRGPAAAVPRCHGYPLPEVGLATESESPVPGLGLTWPSRGRRASNPGEGGLQAPGSRLQQCRGAGGADVHSVPGAWPSCEPWAAALEECPCGFPGEASASLEGAAVQCHGVWPGG